MDGASAGGARGACVWSAAQRDGDPERLVPSIVLKADPLIWPPTRGTACRGTEIGITCVVPTALTRPARVRE